MSHEGHSHIEHDGLQIDTMGWGGTDGLGGLWWPDDDTLIQADDTHHYDGYMHCSSHLWVGPRLDPKQNYAQFRLLCFISHWDDPRPPGEILSQGPTKILIPVSVKKTLLRKMIGMGTLAFRAPNQGLESSFCRWVAGQRLAWKECIFHRHRYVMNPSFPGRSLRFQKSHKARAYDNRAKCWNIGIPYRKSLCPMPCRHMPLLM